MKEIVKRVLGHRLAPTDRVRLEALERDWTFRPSTPDGWTRLIRMIALRSVGRAPARAAIVPIVPRTRWIVYFVFLPSGGLTSAHRFTLERLRAADAGLCVICAAPSPGDVPADLREIADALYWKDLSGFDFSAYALAIQEVARHSPGADLFVMNDSVLGPFVPLDTLWPAMRWDLTGFTASATLQNHIQSYAFHLRGVDRSTVRALASVMPRRFAFQDYLGAVYCQESRFATVAARRMSVGALWYADGERSGDASVLAALPLVEAGFPFLKRSLFTKNGHVYPRAALIDTLRGLGHPVDEFA